MTDAQDVKYQRAKREAAAVTVLLLGSGLLSWLVTAYHWPRSPTLGAGAVGIVPIAYWVSRRLFPDT